MTIKTGDKLNAGTDANVYVALHGDKGKTPRIALQDESQNFKRFERGRADKFVVQTADVGKVGCCFRRLNLCRMWHLYNNHTRLSPLSFIWDYVENCTIDVRERIRAEVVSLACRIGQSFNVLLEVFTCRYVAWKSEEIRKKSLE